MKLNLTKCTFGVTSGEFLGYIVAKRGIKANPKQISAVLDLPDPKTSWEIQRLTGRVAALNRFISRSTDKCLPYYELLRGNKRFLWDEVCEQAFAALKHYLTTPPRLTDAEKKSHLIKQSPRYPELIEQSFRLGFVASNNEAEYEVLIAGLRLAKVVGAKRLQAFCDSQLVASQYSGDYEAKNERMDAYLGVLRKLTSEFDHFELVKVPRKYNCFTDALAALGSNQREQVRQTIPIHTVENPSISLPVGKDVLAISSSITEIAESTTQDVDWRTPFVDYLDKGIFPEDKWESRRLKAKSSNYVSIDGKLHRWTQTKYFLPVSEGEIQNSL
ncbi:hypothetical protein N665_0053s0014 [Sinapis alba]|nr:hypothetical protein N665_0053s0014 [Sinapis alba]